MREKKLIIGIVFLILFFTIIRWIHVRRNNQITLRFGMFTGSNWDVENANSFIIIDRAIERFEKKHPNVNIIYTSGIGKTDYSEWCAQRMLEGNLPDVLMVLNTDFNQYCALGELEELDSFIENDREINKDSIFSTALDIGKGIEGTQYALPYEVVPTLLFVNKTLLKNEGIEMPSKDWTWNDFYTICKKVTRDTNGDGNINQFGTFNYTWLNAMYTSGGSIFDSKNQKVNFTNESIKSSLKFMKELNRLNNGINVTQADFDAGNVAFMPLTFAEYRTYKTYPYKIKKYSNFQWDCITFPARNKGENISKVDALLIGMSHDTKEKETAWEFIKELTFSKESQLDIFKYSQGISVLKDMTKSSEAAEVMQGDMDKGEQVISGEFLCEVIEDGVISPKFLKNEQYEQIIVLANSKITEMFDQNKDIESSMKILEREINQYLNK